MSEQMRTPAMSLLRRGWATITVDGSTCEAFQRLTSSAEAFFTAPEAVRSLSAWSGDGPWSGYQPMPDGDPGIVDHVDRFEADTAVLASTDGSWPWVSKQARRLKGDLVEVDRLCRIIVANCVRAVADLTSRDAAEAHALWCVDDSSTLVVNSYRTNVVPQSTTVKMKEHADFGGLTLIEAWGGLNALQFRSGDGWTTPENDSSEASRTLVVLIGELFAHWIGTEAPVHRVEQDSERERHSTVFFNQPNYTTEVTGPDGTSIVAGEHITAMQERYNAMSA